MSDLHARLARHTSALRVTANITMGGVDRISIKGSRFLLKNADNTDTAIDTLYLDVVIVTGNPNVTKQYFEGAYDPTAQDKAPDCYSHNGVGPSSGVRSPQAATCADCPHNRWGTGRKNDGSPSNGKACSDRKLIAVMHTATGKLYQLNVPATSLGNLYAYIRDITKGVHTAGRPLEPFDFVTRITFDVSKPGQVLLFAKGAQLHDKQLAYIADALDAGQCDRLIAADDKPMPALAAPAKMAPAALAAPAPAATPAPAVPAPTAQERIAAAKAAQKAPQPPKAPEAPLPAAPQFAVPEAAPAGLEGLLDEAGFGVEFEGAMGFKL